MSSVWNIYACSSDAVADPDRQISGGPGLKFRHFGPQFGLAERGGGGRGWPLSHCPVAKGKGKTE